MFASAQKLSKFGELNHFLMKKSQKEFDKLTFGNSEFVMSVKQKIQLYQNNI